MDTQDQILVLTEALKTQQAQISKLTEICEIQQKTIAALESSLDSLKICPSFKIFQRAALPLIKEETSSAKYLAFIDFDKIHEANSAFGYEIVNSKIRKVFSHCRKQECTPIRWFSGDEFVILGEHNEVLNKIVNRLLFAAQKQGLSFTYSIIKIEESIENSVELASQKVSKLKSLRNCERK